MKKWLYLLLLFLLCGCNNKEVLNTFNNDNSYRFYIEKRGNNVILYEDDVNSSFLLVLNKDSKLKIRDLSVDYLVLLENNDNIKIDYYDKYILRDRLVLDGVELFIDNMIGISFGNYLFCIYGDEWYYKNDFGRCDFIYIFNGEEDINISFSDRVKVLFYNEYSEFRTSFLEKMFTSWLDTYVVSNGNVSSLIVNDNGYVVQNKEKE